MKILILEDNDDQRTMIKKVLHSHGYEVEGFDDGSRLIRYLEENTADLLLLDWVVPGVCGLDVLWWVRKRLGRYLPIVFVTNHIREDEIVTALEAGADDYIVKPARPLELVARIRALLRRTHHYQDGATSHILVGRYTLDVINRVVKLDGEALEITHREFEIASLLFSNLGKIVPRDNLIKRVWGRDMNKDSRSLDTHIYRMRQKLRIGESTGLKIRSIYTHGYRLEQSA